MTWQRYDVKIYNEDLNDWTAHMHAAGALSTANKKPDAASPKRDDAGKKKAPRKR